MNPRDTIAATLCRVKPDERQEDSIYGAVIVRDFSPVVDAIVEDLTAAGCTIVPTGGVEKGVEAAMQAYFGEDYQDGRLLGCAVEVQETAEAAMLRALTAASPHMPVPAGFVLVPEEPTREMWAAMADSLYGYKNRHHDKVAGDLYRSMLAAVPKPAALTAVAVSFTVEHRNIDEASK